MPALRGYWPLEGNYKRAGDNTAAGHGGGRIFESPPEDGMG